MWRNRTKNGPERQSIDHANTTALGYRRTPPMVVLAYRLVDAVRWVTQRAVIHPLRLIGRATR